MSTKLGVQITGYDKNSKVREFIKEQKIPYLEKECEAYLKTASLNFVDSIEDVIVSSDVVFVSVQTPHSPEFEGITPTPEIREDFDYSFLKSAIKDIVAAHQKNADRELIICIISTVLPGTIRREILPLLPPMNKNISLCYNPFFIAMGQAIEDFLNPEFVLLGGDDKKILNKIADIYKLIHDKPFQIMELESAEITKVSYNTFIGFKIIFANAIGEIVDKIGGDADEVTSALACATDRIISSKYLSVGMGDGGGCHPRDQIAMSSFAQKNKISADLFEFIAKSRDAQTLALAKFIEKIYRERAIQTPVVVLGLAYKPNINLTLGSPASLLIHYLESLQIPFEIFDPHVFPSSQIPENSKLFFVATKHDLFKNINFPTDSIVINPWGNFLSESNQKIEMLLPGRLKIN